MDANLSTPSASPAPTSPTSEAVSALRPLGLDQVGLDPDGLLGAWQRRNAEATLPHCIEQLERDGALDNLRRVAAGDDQEHTGMWFSDSDVYKTLEAAAWEVGRNPAGAEDLVAFLTTTADLLAAVQEDDGYLNSYFTGKHADQRWQEPHWSHELYCAGHLIQAAVAAARVGVADKLVTVARRCADLLVARFGPDGTEAVCGHPEIETALVELYRTTGHRPYLDLAVRFVNQRGRGLLRPPRSGEPRFGLRYYQDHLPVRETSEVTGHAVRQLYLLAGVVDVAAETADADLLAAAGRMWDSAFQTKTYLTGAHGSRHRDEAFGDPYELPSDRAYAETCAAIASFQWNWRMLLATGAPRYADELERVLYNAIAVATATDGRHFFYSNPLHLRTGHDGSDEDAPSARLPWYSCACCPPNLARLMASLHGYVATTDPDGLQLHLYASGTVRAHLGGGLVALTVRTGYPWHGRVEVTVTETAADRPWTLALRVPSWCADVTVTVDGVPAPATAERGYLRLHRTWSVGASIIVDLRMPARLATAHPRVDAVRGCAALLRGPLVYCLEQVDLPTGVVLEDVRLDISAQVPAVERTDLPQIPVALTATGHLIDASASTLYPRLDPWASSDQAGTERSSSDQASTERSSSDQASTERSSFALTAVPYFLWGNRTPGSMRVWIPVAPDSTHRSD